MEGNSVEGTSGDMVAGRATSGRRRAPRRGSALAAVIIAAVLGLGACGGGSGGSSNAGGSTNSPQLAFARCVRSHGVPNWPDPDRGGNPPPGSKQIAAGNPQFPAASRACQHLLPNGGQLTQAELQQAWNDFRHFAGCMRSHGVPNWPDPTAAPQHPERPIFNLQAAGIDPNSSQIRQTAQACESQLHLSHLPQVS